jgi:uncharacterized protein (DUF1800 family)
MNVSSRNYRFVKDLCGTLKTKAMIAGFLILATSLVHGATNEERVVRFLTQATFGPKPSEISTLLADVNARIAQGQNQDTALRNACSAWINAQFALSPTELRPLIGHTLVYTGLPLGNALDPIQWRGIGDRALTQRVISAADQLRHRTAVALSEILVVSANDDRPNANPLMMADYYDTLLKGVDGNYGDLLTNVSFHPAMGHYLSHLNNQKANLTAGIYPDENYAREVMQLFSCGLFHLRDDGEFDGSPATPTYDNTKIIEMAKVFTGLVLDPTVTFSDGRDYTDDTMIGNFQREIYPMAGVRTRHQLGTKALIKLTRLGTEVTVASGSFPSTDAGVKDEIAWVCRNVLAAHASTPPFIVKQLIKRFVTSNPSPAYVSRVVQVWKNNGSNVRGDLKAVVKAILLDAEALNTTGLTSTTHGKLREPYLVATHMMRAFGAAPQSTPYAGKTPFPGINYWPPIRGSGSNEGLSQELLEAPSVFNFFLPTYSPTGPIRNANLTGPEFQLMNDSTVLTTWNYLFQRANRTPVDYTHESKYTLRYNPADPPSPIGKNAADYAPGKPANNRSNIVLTAELGFLPTGVPSLTQANALLAHLNTKLCYGQLSTTNRDLIRAALLSTRTDYTRDQRVRDAIFLVLATPDYLVQR